VQTLQSSAAGRLSKSAGRSATASAAAPAARRTRMSYSTSGNRRPRVSMAASVRFNDATPVSSASSSRHSGTAETDHENTSAAFTSDQCWSH